MTTQLLICDGRYRDGRRTRVYHTPGARNVRLECVDADGVLIRETDQHHSLVEAQIDAATCWADYVQEHTAEVS